MSFGSLCFPRNLDHFIYFAGFMGLIFLIVHPYYFNICAVYSDVLLTFLILENCILTLFFFLVSLSLMIISFINLLKEPTFGFIEISPLFFIF